VGEAYGNPENEPMTDQHGEIIPEEPEDIEMGFDRLTALIIGIDNGDSQNPDAAREEDKIKEADMIILIDINARTGEFMTSYLPRDMQVNAGEYTLRLGAVYAEHGAEMLVRTVRSHTGIQPDFYCVLDYGSIISLFDILGRIDYNVPANMYYLPRPYNYDSLSAEEKAELKPEIDLRAGFQRLDGEQILQLLRFRGYGNNYLLEETGRENTHKSFIQEVIRQQLTFENLSRAHEIYEAVINCIAETNMTAEDFRNYTNLIFGFSEFEFKSVEYPGTRSFLDGVYWFTPIHSDAMRAYRDYRR
jgi:LCP family protein required for cell wall assembly